MNVVLDTSVAVAWYLNEAFSPAARQWQERCLAGKVVPLVPSLHYLEFANVLRTYVRRGDIEESLALDIYALHCEAPLEVVDPPAEAVLSTALEYGATAYDAAYILLALMQEAQLLTAERTTTPWVTKLGARATRVT